ncbi:hypothetical protein K470DRAFT_254779 [Piedraia hortae CBS 480.64]|uniref:Transmembrane protein 135 N-terminal domain-containing protein n=1 Tax=Piedraia hortae CBS 480.64 TaxID=1314780 RepID=A0A6A7C9L5_9PEZI|nr:hypothetical protein K470DRAFT_254779 [Piedraia hortae CBS 480.64]
MGRDKIDPITRAALRYTISPSEYEALHKYIISRAPSRVQKCAPQPPRYEKMTKGNSEGGDYTAAALRAALRVFGTTYLGLKAWDSLIQAVSKRPPKKSQGNARTSLSFAAILFFYRLFDRFFRRLRLSLLDEKAIPFRKRNPLIARLLTSVYTPAVGASLSGFFLLLSPAKRLRSTLAIYSLTRSLEFVYNALENGEIIWPNGRPWWFGSWMLMPFATAQLLHCLVFNRDCFPSSYGRLLHSNGPEYVFRKGHSLSSFDVVDALASMSTLGWPNYISPILFPNKPTNLPPTLTKIRAITDSAHPGITNSSCALLHPKDPSCSRVYLTTILSTYPGIVKVFTIIYTALALLSYRKYKTKGLSETLNTLAARILKAALLATGSTATCWGSACLFANYLPRRALPTKRWYLSGFLAGMWAVVAPKERAMFTYSARVALQSALDVARKKGYLKRQRGLEVMLFTVALACTGCVVETDSKSLRSNLLVKTWETGLKGM